MRLPRFPFALAIIVTVGAAGLSVRSAKAQEASDAPGASAEEGGSDHEPCDGKARLRGPVFESGSAEVRAAALPMLDLVAQEIAHRCADRVIVIEGHTDAAGDAAANQALSERRALAVKKLLVARGVRAERLETVGYGDRRPITTATTSEARAINRRITFVIRGEAEAPAAN